LDYVKSLEERHGVKVKFRALYIEKNDDAFAKQQGLERLPTVSQATDAEGNRRSVGKCIPLDHSG